MARYSLFMLKVPLNTNQPTNQLGPTLLVNLSSSSSGKGLPLLGTRGESRCPPPHWECGPRRAIPSPRNYLCIRNGIQLQKQKLHSVAMKLWREIVFGWRS